jgi:stage II sporulation protein D
MKRHRNAGSAGIAGSPAGQPRWGAMLPADPGETVTFPGSLATSVRGVQAGCLRARQYVGIKHPLVLAVIAFGSLLLAWAAVLKNPWHSSLGASSSESINADNIDQRLQRAATLALGDRRGAVIVMDPQTGRVRAVVNPELAFAKDFPLGSAIKPFTALAALRSGVIDEDSRTLCHEKYSHHAFQTTCSHPRDLPPLNPTEAIAYSCNYYFSTVGERLTEASFTSTLREFGFGRKSGINAGGESIGQLQRNDWLPQNAIGEGNYLQATPIQVINAYVALVNGGRLFTPRLASPTGFVSSVQANLEIKDRDRNLVITGMRGAVRYGSAEKANLYSLPAFVFGKTGTATEINGFRTHGWFVGFSSPPTDTENPDSEATPEKINLAVLVFLTKGHGFEAAQLARPIFAEYGRVGETRERGDADTRARAEEATSSGDSPRLTNPAPSRQSVRVRLVRENITRTVAFEDYVRGVVAAEGSMEKEPEALKALAIAVRTYAYKNLDRHARDGYDFCTSTHCQRYRPLDLDPSGYVSPLIIEAVEATRGEMLRSEDNELADSYFSASCGGATANLATLWGGSAPPYLRGVRDEYCGGEAHHSWTDVISQTQLLKALQTDPRTNVGERLVNLSVLRTDASGRAELIAVEGNRRVTVKGWDFKIIVGRALGWNLLKSSRFEIVRSGLNFVFRGSGFGHGLGLCQEGAHIMAERGANYRQILAKYFPTTQVTNEFRRLVSADLMWGRDEIGVENETEWPSSQTALARVWGGFDQEWRASRKTLTSEDFRINYPSTTDQREVEVLLSFLQSSRKSLIARVAAAKVPVQFPAIEIFINETTGDFVGRTGLPYWAAAATRGNKIELQPLAALKRRRILETTLRHELVHTMVDIVSRERAPRWLAEGLAIHISGEGPLVARYEPRPRMAVEEITKQLGYSQSMMSSEDMRKLYAAAYGEVRRLIKNEGEANVWRRLAR